MNFYKDKTYSTLKFDPSRYDDYSYGARVEYGLETDNNFLKLAVNYKKDVHRSYETSPTTNIEKLSERYEDHTISIGAEDSYKITQDLELLAGISYDRLKADSFFDTNPAFLSLITLSSQSAINPQAALIYTVDNNSKIRGSVSQKTYFPSMKDKYSRRMGSSVPNVDLDKEVANHFELGYTYQTQNLLVSPSIYYTKVKDAIDLVAYTPDPSLEQNQNIGTFDHKGLELDAAYTDDGTKVGANYAYINVKNKKDNDVKRTRVPKHQIFAFAQQEIGAGFSLYGNMKYRNGMYDQDSNRDYVKMASFTTFDAKVIYAPIKEFLVEMGVKNLTDKFVEYGLDYPEAGREYFATMNYKF
jgi:iron complex outermembrane receptor protein